MVAEANEHVLALDTPMAGKRPFNAAAKRPCRDGVRIRGRNEPVAAACGDQSTLIEDRSLHRNESGTAFDIEHGGTPSIPKSACDHSIPIANFGASQYVRRRPYRAHWEKRTEQGIESRTLEPHVARLAFNPEHEGRADWLPIAAQSTATDETAVEADIVRMNTFAPSCDDAARKGSERGVAQIGENRIPFIPGATDITADVAAGPIENGRRWGRHRRTAQIGRASRSSNCQCPKSNRAEL